MKYVLISIVLILNILILPNLFHSQNDIVNEEMKLRRLDILKNRELVTSSLNKLFELKSDIKIDFNIGYEHSIKNTRELIFKNRLWINHTKHDSIVNKVIEENYENIKNIFLKNNYCQSLQIYGLVKDTVLFDYAK